MFPYAQEAEVRRWEGKIKLLAYEVNDWESKYYLESCEISGCFDQAFGVSTHTCAKSERLELARL